MHQNLTITWHGHSCFSIDNGTRSLTLDPYSSKMTGYPSLHVETHALLSSHLHEDHHFPAAVKILPAASPVLQRVESGEDWPSPPDPGLFYYKAVDTCHDEEGGGKRGKNTVHLVRSNGLVVAHLGDLGHVLSPHQVQAIGRPDLLLIPIGGVFTLDASTARQVVRQIQPANIAPMHYQIGFGDFPIATVEPFLKLVETEWQIRRLPDPVLLLDHDSFGNCYVFQYQSGV